MALAIALALPALAAAADPPGKGKVGVRVTDTAAGDFDGDGRVDLLVAGGCPGRPCFSVVLNRASGLTVKPRVGTKEKGPAFVDVEPIARGSIVALDGTRKGRVVANVASSAPRVTALALPRAADMAAVGDFDEDGKPDLVFVDAQTRSAFTALGRGGGFEVKDRFFATGGSRPTDVATGDFDGDGDDDLVVAGGGRVTFLSSAGDGSFGFPATVTVGGAPHTLAVGDFDLDGSADVVVGASTGARLIEAQGAEPSGAIDVALGTLLAGTRPVGIVVADVTRDNLADVVALNRGSGTVSTFVATAGGGYGTPIRSVPVGANPISIDVLRFDSDGIPDVVVANAAGGGLGTVTVLRGNGSGGFSLFGAPPPGTTPDALPLDFTLGWKHPVPNPGFSNLCADITGPSGGTLTLSMTGPGGDNLSGTLQLPKQAAATARRTFRFRIEQYGSHTVKITATKNGRSVTKTKEITVTAEQGTGTCGG